jgi:hypothetical protein
MTQFVFGSGTLICRRTDVANTPPALLGTLQDLSIDFDRKIEALLGQHNVAVALGGGELKISGKAKFARFQTAQINNLLLGQTVTSNAMLQMAEGEAGAVPATPFQITVANGATFQADLGVFNAQTGVQLQPVASAPATGQYSVSAAGVYTFAAADTGLAVLIFYAYNSTGGNKIVAANQLMGPMPTFELYAKESFTQFGIKKDLIVKLNACVSSKLAVAFNNQKFAIPEFDFQAQADAANNWGTISLSE